MAECAGCGTTVYHWHGEFRVGFPDLDMPMYCMNCVAGRTGKEDKTDLTKIISLKHALTEVAKVMAEGDGREGRDPDDWKDKTEDYFTEKLLRHTVTHVQEGHHHIDTDSQCKTLAHIAALALYALENRMQLESTL